MGLKYARWVEGAGWQISRIILVCGRIKQFIGWSFIIRNRLKLCLIVLEIEA